MTRYLFDKGLTVSKHLHQRMSLLLTLFLMVILLPSQAMATPEIEVWAGTSAEVTAGTAMEITDGQAIPTLGGLALNETTIAPAQTFTIRNMGTSLLKITGLNISQTSIGNPFSQPVLSSADILPGSMATFQTVFNPQLAIQPVLYAKPYPATIQIFNDDSDEGLFNFTVIGQVRMQSAETPRFMVLDGTTRVNNGDVITIGTTSIGKPFSKTLTLWDFSKTAPDVINLLPNPGDIIKLTGANPTEFEVSPFGTNTLDVGKFTMFTITLKGNTSSPIDGHLATVSFTSNDPLFSGANPPFTFDIKGIVATIPEINVMEGVTPIVDDVTTVDFGTYLVNAADVTKTFTVAEVGGANLTLSNLLLPTGFSLVGTFPNAVTTNGSVTFTVKLDTSKASTFNGEIVFNNNDGNGDENPFNIKVKGTVVGNLTDPEIEVWEGTAAEVTAGTAVAIKDGQTTAIDFSTTMNGTPPTKTFTVKNGGGAILQLTALSPLPAGFSLVTPFPQSIPANGTASFTVRLDNTTVEHTYSGTIQIFSNDSVSDGSIENPFDFPIKGIVSTVKPEIDVLVDGSGSITDGQADIIGLGNTVVGTPVQRTFTIKNVGTADLTLTSPVAFDQGGDGFTINSFKVNTLSPGSETTFTVSLDATIAGIFGGVLSFGSSDSDENPFNFSISGTVDQVVPTTQEIQVWQDSPPTAEIGDGQAVPIDFGETTVGTPLVKTFTVKNIGAAGTALALTNLALSPDGSKFALIGDLTPTVAGPDGKIAFTIQFDSAVAGIFEAKLSLFSNDADENPFDVSIKATALGKATTPEIEVFDEATEIVDGTTIIDFGAATTKTFTVQNKGNADLTLDTVTFSGGGNGFKVESFVPATLAPGESTSFKVTVTTTTIGTYTGTLSFANNDANENPFDFDIKAVINASASPEIQVLDGTLDLVDNQTIVDYSTAIAKTFTIKNIGNAPLTASNPITFVDGGNGFTITSFQAPLTLAPQETTTFQVMVNATQAGTYSGTLAFANNDSDENPFSFTVKATIDPLTSQCDVNNLVECKTESSCAAVGGVFTLNRCNIVRFLIHPQKGTSIALAATADQTWNTPTLFSGGVSVDGSALFTIMDVSATQTVTWGGNIAVNPSQVGQKANLLFVVGIEPPSLDDPLGYSGNEDTIYYAFDGILKSFFPVNVYASQTDWPAQLAKLTAQPFKNDVVLTDHVSLDLWTGKIGDLVTGLTANTKARIYTFFGYVLADGTIVYNGMPIMTTMNQ